MRADLLNRIERVKAVLERRQSMGVTLVYADGSKRSMGTLEAVDEICRRDDVVDVLSEGGSDRLFPAAGHARAVGFLRPGGAGGAVAANSQTSVNLTGANPAKVL